MAEVTASLVKALREKTGAGMMDCKKALIESDGDMESAVDWLRKKGLAAAAKKSSRIAKDGLVGVATRGGVGAIVEVNSETDFVARSDTFQAFVTALAELALDHSGDADALRSVAYPGTGRTVEQEEQHLIATIGENIRLRRVVHLNVGDGVLGTYMHSQTAPGLGKIGVLVALETTASGEQTEDLAKKLAMHVAAAIPQAVSRDDVDPSLLERERAILTDQAKASGKPDNIIEKMVIGRLSKFFEEICLLDQTYVIDGDSKVSKVLEAAAKETGAPATVSGFVRVALGEGIDKPEDDFAAEVANVAGG
jgi:elongation factor Ts